MGSKKANHSGIQPALSTFRCEDWIAPTDENSVGQIT